MTAAMATTHTATTVIHCFMECREELLPNLGIPRTRFRGEIVALFRSINPISRALWTSVVLERVGELDRYDG